MFTDTHCHLYKEYYKNISLLIKKCVDNKIPRFINNGTDMKSNREVLNYVFTYEGMYGAIGIHPESVEDYSDKDIDFIREHINDEKVVAIGEIGLDYHWVSDNKDKQIELFEKTVSIS